MINFTLHINEKIKLSAQLIFTGLTALLLLSACKPAEVPAEAQSATQANASSDQTTASPAKAAEFVSAAEATLEKLGQHSERNAWVLANFITFDTELLAATASEQFTIAKVQAASEAAKFSTLPGLDENTRRKLGYLRTGITIPAPRDPQKSAEQAEIGSKLSGMYGKGKYCRSEDDCLDLGALENILAESRDPAAQLEAWDGWHQISKPMKPLYGRQVELANEAARDLGFPDLGELWRSDYDMEPAAFSAELDRVWGQVKPLYEALQCHVRAELNEFYGDEIMPAQGPIPAHLLGNMWAQSWENVYDIAGPGEADTGYDLTAILQEREFTPISMVETGEAFFSSLGFAELPDTFWERSLFVKPADRDVICHASAWNVDEVEDLRIKMCIEVNAEDFRTIHHELGHNYYQRAYNHHSYLFRTSANDGFHEAIGDTLSLSITPKYLVQIGLLEAEPDASGDLALLMQTALEKVAFLPFGLVMDQWRWRVFAGEVGPDGYNDLWWKLREQYQGVAAPNQRPDDAFDPGAKYHIPGNTPYARYFLAHVLQFQFFRSLCELAGNEGPIHRCSFYGSQVAGDKLNELLEMGRSQPWPVALEALTGSAQMDAGAMLDYFAPLKIWLDEQNKDRNCGW
jgi:peptidyl-dipeptidase A